VNIWLDLKTLSKPWELPPIKTLWAEGFDLSIGIDEIFKMLSWNNEEKIQAKGIDEAKKLKTFQCCFSHLKVNQLGKTVQKCCSAKVT